ncbi:hypothetical protein LSAT2_001433 [Lamellibrachia satsuma]|nr:hypothetical protein LSAT2_001433 [Lamellibrachia satsuma]
MTLPLPNVYLRLSGVCQHCVALAVRDGDDTRTLCTHVKWMAFAPERAEFAEANAGTSNARLPHAGLPAVPLALGRILLPSLPKATIAVSFDSAERRLYNTCMT